MERATELHWLKWFYQAADIAMTEEDRIELERQFYKEEGLLIPKAYEIDENPAPKVYKTGDKALTVARNMVVEVELINKVNGSWGVIWPDGALGVVEESCLA